MKNNLPWILAIVFAATTFVLFSGNQKKGQELVKLRADSQEMEKMHRELEELRKSNVDPNEVERLRKENEEVYKLRGQVAQLQKKLAERPPPQAPPVYAEQPIPQPLEPAPPPQPEDPTARLQREQAEKCIENIKIIEEAKTMWAVANNKTAGVTMTIADIAIALPNNTMPVCPAGGQYHLNEVGIPPHCTIPGHSLLP